MRPLSSVLLSATLLLAVPPGGDVEQLQGTWNLTKQLISERSRWGDLGLWLSKVISSYEPRRLS